MPSDKRERQRANRAKKVEEVEAVEVTETRRSRFMTWGILAAIIVAGLLLFAFCSGGGDDDVQDTFVTGEDEGASDEFVPWSGTGQLSGSNLRQRANIYDAAPPMTIDTSKDYEAVITTDRGVMRFDLYDDESPVTVNNFVSLARDGYYDGVSFHRVIADFMAQAGDPTGTGAGGPGYQFEDEFDNGLELNDRGILAMANAGPATNGSQFFITFVATDFLTGAHTVFGKLTEGDDVLGQIRLRDPSSDPAVGDIMTSVEIVES